MLRRFVIFSISVFWGMIIVYFMLIKDKNRDLMAWLPSRKVKSKLIESNIEYSSLVGCQLECLSIDKSELSELILESEVEFGKSKVREIPKKYLLSFESSKIQEILMSQYDSFAVIDRVTFKDENCNCQ